MQAGTATLILLIDTVSRALIETSQPRIKVLLSLGYQVGKLTINLRSTYFGEVTAREKPAGRPHRSQTFGGKNLFDVSLVYAITKQLGLTLGDNNITKFIPTRSLTRTHCTVMGRCHAPEMLTSLVSTEHIITRTLG